MPQPSRPLRPAPLALGIRHAMGGFGLLELLLGAGISLAAAGLVLAGYRMTQARADARNEVDNVRELSRAVERSFGNIGSYAGVSSQRVLDDNLAPWRLRFDASRLSNTWGGVVEVSPYTVDNLGDAFEVTYKQVPDVACVPMVEHLARDAWDIRVGEVSVLQATAGLDPAVLARQCAQFDGELAFVYHSGLVSGQAVAAAPLAALPPGTPAAPPPAPPSVVVPSVPTPPGTGPATLPPTVSLGCGPAPAPPACPWAPGYTFQPAPFPSCWTLAGSCDTAPPTSPPVASPSNPPASTPPDPPFVSPCVPSSESRVSACPAGNYGQRNESRALQCGPDPSIPEAWARSYTPGPWSLVSSTCTSCPAPASQSTYQWVATATVCPAGSYGMWDWERQQRATRTVSYTCPSPAWTLPAPSYSAWSAWSDTGTTRNLVNTCATCPPPFAQPETQWLTSTPNCPAGEYGAYSWEFEQTRSRTGSYSCPAGTTSLPPVSWAPWSSWSNTGATRNAVDTCATCPSSFAQPESRWLTSAPNCPAGQYGAYAWEYEQARSRTGSYACAAGTTSLPPVSWAPWSGWANTGATRNEVNSCATCPAPATDNQTQWLATAPNCPAGQYGTRSWEYEQARTRPVSYACPANTSTLPAPAYGAWSGWASTGATRNQVNTCATCPAPYVDTASEWQARSASCPAGQVGTNTWEEFRSRSRPVSYACPANSTTLPAANVGPFGAWTWTGTTRNQVNTCAPECVAPPSYVQDITSPRAPENRTVACPAGQTGTMDQSRTKTATFNRTWTYSCPAPTGPYSSNYTDAFTGYTYGSWTSTDTSRCTPVPSCPPTPPASSATKYCPAGQYGSWTQTTIWTAASAPTCATSSVSPASPPAGACVACPAPSSDIDNDWEARTAACPAGQVGTNTWEEIRTRSRIKSYSCPAGTSILPTPTYGAYGGWSWTGTKRNEVNTCTPAPTGVCPAREFVMGCVVQNKYSGSPTGDYDVIYDGDTGGVGYDSSDAVRCVIGYADTLQANHLPQVPTDTNLYRLKITNPDPINDWDSTYTRAEDNSSYVEIFAKKADGTNGARCYGTVKMIFNYEGK